MLPTLLIGDHVFVNKFVYGAHIPLLDVQLPALREPRRGEIVVFDLGRSGGRIQPLDRCPGCPSESFIKRLVALPGDRVEVRGGEVLVNGQHVARERTGESFLDDKGTVHALLRERLDGCDHAVLDRPDFDPPSMAERTVPAGSYFFLGDNRDASNDSRFWGVVPRRDIRGPAFLIYWSWNNRESWLAMLNPLTWLRLLASETRWSRTGDSLDCRAGAGE
jgi:signal peptidase I